MKRGTKDMNKPTPPIIDLSALSYFDAIFAIYDMLSRAKLYPERAISVFIKYPEMNLNGICDLS